MAQFRKYNPSTHGTTPECRDGLRMAWKALAVIGVIVGAVGVLLFVIDLLLGAIITLAFAVVFIIGAFFAWRAARRWDALLDALHTNGLVTTGTVIRASTSQQQHGQNQRNGVRGGSTTTTRTNKLHVTYRFTDDKGRTHTRRACWVTSRQQRRQSNFKPKAVRGVMNKKDSIIQARQGWNDFGDARAMQGQPCEIAFTSNGSVFLRSSSRQQSGGNFTG